MIARLFLLLLFASLTALADDDPGERQKAAKKPPPASGLRKAMSEAQKREAEKPNAPQHRQPRFSGKGLRRLPQRK
jgi:hypothetical protein